jgi:hypothetical protein
MTVMQIIEAYELNFAVGNVIKYMLRAGKKGGEDALDDLKKAQWYLNAELERRTAEDTLQKKKAREGLTELGRYEAMTHWGSVVDLSMERPVKESAINLSMDPTLLPNKENQE